MTQSSSYFALGTYNSGDTRATSSLAFAVLETPQLRDLLRDENVKRALLLLNARLGSPPELSIEIANGVERGFVDAPPPVDEPSCGCGHGARPEEELRPLTKYLTHLGPISEELANQLIAPTLSQEPSDVAAISHLTPLSVQLRGFAPISTRELSLWPKEVRQLILRVTRPASARVVVAIRVTQTLTFEGDRPQKVDTFNVIFLPPHSEERFLV